MLAVSLSFGVSSDVWACGVHSSADAISKERWAEFKKDYKSKKKTDAFIRQLPKKGEQTSPPTAGDEKVKQE